MRIAYKLLVTLLKDQVHYPGRVAADMLVVTVRFGVVSLLYAYVYMLNGGAIGGLGFAAAIWSIFFYFLLFMLQMRGLSRVIMQDVRSGAIEVLMNRPVSYLWYRMWWQFGSGLYTFVWIGLVGVFVLTLLVGVPAVMLTPLFALTFAGTFIGGLLLTVAMYTLIGLGTFWIEDIDPIYWIADKLAMMLGGAYIPIALMPSSLQAFASYSPFGATYMLTHATYPTWVHDWPVLMSVQLAWVIVLSGITLFVFNRAQRIMSVNGG